MKITILKDYDPSLPKDISDELDAMVAWAMSPDAFPWMVIPQEIEITVVEQVGSIPTLPLACILSTGDGVYLWVRYCTDGHFEQAVCQEGGEYFGHLV